MPKRHLQKRAQTVRDLLKSLSANYRNPHSEYFCKENLSVWSDFPGAVQVLSGHLIHH